ncbi:hypothetical protein HKX48_007874 [Thoreauomyces humboldtii]|nr:hypothetical protein HKX48_007874 [Thoreauomyces humboldtii]
MFCTQPYPYRINNNDRTCDSYLRAMHHQRQAQEQERIRRQQMQRRYEYEAALALQRQREEEEARREAMMIREYQRQQQIQAHRKRLRAQQEWEHRQHQIAVQRAAMAAAEKERMLQIQERERRELEARNEWNLRRIAMEEQERDAQRQWAIRQLLQQRAARPDSATPQELESNSAPPIPEPNADNEEMDWETVAGSDADSEAHDDSEADEGEAAETIESDIPAEVPAQSATPSATVPLAIRRATRILQHHFRHIRPKLLALHRITEDLSATSATLSEFALSTPVVLTPAGTCLPQDNKPIAAYEETLLQLLIRADAIESEGVRCVRDSRKEVVAAITKRLDEIDAVKKAAMAEFESAKSVATTVSVPEPTESLAMDIDEQPASAQISGSQTTDAVEPLPSFPGQKTSDADETSSGLEDSEQSEAAKDPASVPSHPVASQAPSAPDFLMSSSHPTLDIRLGHCRQETAKPESTHQAVRVPVQT